MVPIIPIVAVIASGIGGGIAGYMVGKKIKKQRLKLTLKREKTMIAIALLTGIAAFIGGCIQTGFPSKCGE